MAVTASVDTMGLVGPAMLVRRAEGAWLVWQTTDGYNETYGPVSAVPLSESGEIAGPVVPGHASEDQTAIRAATVMGSKLVVAGIGNVRMLDLAISTTMVT